MREIISNKLSEELKKILIKYFNKDTVDLFIYNIVEDLIILTSITAFDRGEKNISSDSESYFSSKLRSVADRIITFSKENLDESTHYRFMIDFGSLMITDGELFLATEIFQNVLNYSTKNKLELIKANTNLYLARINLRTANWKKTQTYIKNAKVIFEKHNDKQALSQCYHLLGGIAIEKGDLKSAKVYFEKGLTFLDTNKDKLHVGNIELNLGIISQIEENFDKAFKYYDSSLQKFEELEDYRRVAEVMNNIGMIYINQEKYEFALYEYDECIKLALEGRYLPTLGIGYLNKAYAYSEINELKLSSYYASKAMDVCYRINDVLSIADIYKIKGIIYRKQFELQLAEEYFKASLRLNEELKNEMNYAETSFEIGLLYHDLNAGKQYEFYFNKALEYYKKVDAKNKIQKIKEYLK